MPQITTHSSKEEICWELKPKDKLRYKAKSRFSWNFNSQVYAPKDFPGGSDGEVSAYNARDPGSIPGLGRSPGEGKGNPLQYSCLENPMDGGTW